MDDITRMTEQTARSARRPPRFLALLVVAVLATLGLAACGDDDDDESAGPDVGADVGDVRDDELGDDELGDDELDFTEVDIGEQVEVSAEVSEIFSPAIFAMAGEGGPEPVLVVARNPGIIPETISDNAVVQVTGTVHELIEVVDVGDFEDEFADEGPFEFGAEDEAFFGDEALDDFEGDRFLIASQVEVLDPTEDGGDEAEELEE